MLKYNSYNVSIKYFIPLVATSWYMEASRSETTFTLKLPHAQLPHLPLFPTNFANVCLY